MENLSSTISIHHGDCYEFLDGITDITKYAILTDPPYGMNERTKRGSSGRSGLTKSLDWEPVIGDDKEFNPERFIQFQPCVLWGANYFANKLPVSFGWLVWDKSVGVVINDNSDCEVAWSNIKQPMRLFSHLWKGMMKASERHEQRVHPTQKPIALMDWCLAITGLRTAGKIILDPFMGSSPVGLACIKAGLPYVGIEIDENYYQIARKRLQDAIQQAILL